MPNSVFQFVFCSFTLIYMYLNISECYDIKLHSLISSLPAVCQIKVSTLFLESENSQESKIPLEIIKLRLPHNMMFSSKISDVFGFLPRPANRTNCAINLHYLTTNPNESKTQKEEISPVNIFTYSVYISNSVVKTNIHSQFIKQKRYSSYPHNIWLLNAVELSSLISNEVFLVSDEFKFRRPYEFFITDFKPSRELRNRLAVISYTIKHKNSRFCPTLALESISNVERNCHNAHNLYNYMSQGDATIKEWKEKLREKFAVHVTECEPA